MKKLMVLAAVALMAVCSQAASFKWTAKNVMDPVDTASKWSGAVEIFMSEAGAASFAKVADASISAGVLNYTENITCDDTKSYDFYFTGKDDSGAIYTSTTVPGIAAHATQTKSVTFTGGSWSTVPEPTSGLLLLLGVAGLALKRRRV